MELAYTKVGDYYIPDLALDDDTEYEIGVYGRMREKFLKEHHPGVYNRMLLYGELWKHLAEIDAACHERMDFLIPAMAKQEGVTEALKASNQMEWVGFLYFVQSNAGKFSLDFVFLCRFQADNSNPQIADIKPQKIGIPIIYLLPKSAPPSMLYSGHKESGLIRISQSIGLGGPGWARGLYMDRKSGEARHGLPA